MGNSLLSNSRSRSRRAFLKTGLAAGTTGVGMSLLAENPAVLARDDDEDRRGGISRGDAALLRFAAAAETLEADFWIQYNELGGVQDSEVPEGSGNPAYTEKLENLDEDFPIYVHDTRTMRSRISRSSMRTCSRSTGSR